MLFYDSGKTKTFEKGLMDSLLISGKAIGAYKSIYPSIVIFILKQGNYKVSRKQLNFPSRKTVNYGITLMLVDLELT